MRVARRGRGRGVPEDAPDRVEVDAGIDEQAGAGVAQVVPMHVVHMRLLARLPEAAYQVAVGDAERERRQVWPDLGVDRDEPRLTGLAVRHVERIRVLRGGRQRS